MPLHLSEEIGLPSRVRCVWEDRVHFHLHGFAGAPFEGLIRAEIVGDDCLRRALTTNHGVNMIDRSTLGQAVAGDAAHVLHPMREGRLLHALINGRSPIDGARRGHTAESIDGDHIRSTSWTCRYTNNDNGLGKSNEKGQDRSSAPLLRALNQTAVAFVPLSPCNQI